ncbi:MAG: peptide chain release factor 2 [Candidatus Parabeggiatoa sp. nov. 1]|nr:MAG: peptide chain release factor 2 [Gammaproteobacteria bacterium]
MEFKTIFQRLALLQDRVNALKNSFTYTTQLERLSKIGGQIEKLEQERLVLEKCVQPVNQFENALLEQGELLELASFEIDHETAKVVSQDLERLEQQFPAFDINLFFSGERDARNAFLDIQSGTGDMEAEAQDWANLLSRVYLRWAERHGFVAQILNYSPGDKGGAKSVVLHVAGEYASGWLRTETGKHRLVRQSPVDPKNRSSTSFVEVSVVPEVNDVEIEINPTSLRMERYRAERAGCAHILRTESSVRLTHLPTNTVVQCEWERSWQKNKVLAMKYLKAKLFALKMQQCNVANQSAVENPNLSRNPPIRSYVLDKSYIKDLRTSFKTQDVEAVLDGYLDDFIKVALSSGL